MRLDLDEARLDLGDAQGLRPGFALSEEPRPLAVGGEHRLERGCSTTRRLLGEKADAMAARQLDRPVIGLQGAADQIEQSRFPGTVAADQPDLAASQMWADAWSSSRRPVRPPTRYVTSERVSMRAF